MARQGRARYRSGSKYLRGGVWWVRWREVARRTDGVVDYVQHRESTKSDDPDYAESFLRRKMLEIGRPMAVDPKKRTYEELRDNYLAHCASKNPPMRSLTKDNEGNPTLATLPLLDRFFGGWRAADITTQVIRRFRREAKDTKTYGGRPRGEKRMNRYVRTLSAMFHQAVRDDLITAAEMPSYFPQTGEPNEAQGAVFIDRKWYGPLREALKEPLRSAFTLGYNYAVRVGEMRRLRWRDIDLKSRIVTLPGSMTKTGEPRVVPLPEGFDRKPGKPDDLVFDLGDRRDQWRSACVKIGAAHFECRECGARCKGRKCPAHGRLPIKRMRYVGPQLRHTRHTAVRNMVDSGVNRDRAKAISGHKTDSMFSRYNIGKAADVEEVRRAVEQFHRAPRRHRS